MKGTTRRPDPTQADIRAKCRQIRDGWSRRILEQRTAYPAVPWEVPECELSGVEYPTEWLGEDL